MIYWLVQTKSGDEVAKVQREVIAFLCVIKLQLCLMVL